MCSNHVRCIFIYIYKEECLCVCLPVLYAFNPCDSYDHQSFHDACLGPKEGRRGVKICNRGEGWVRFHPGGPVIASVTKLSMDLPYVQRKVERGLLRPSGEGSWVSFHPDDDILRLFGPCDS